MCLAFMTCKGVRCWERYATSGANTSGYATQYIGNAHVKASCAHLEQLNEPGEPRNGEAEEYGDQGFQDA